MNNWTDERRDKAVELYEKAKPTPETTFKIVKEIAEELDVSPNGVRMILTKAGVYIRKDEATEYQDLETATQNSTYYRDVDFRGTVRISGAGDAYCDLYDEEALLGEDFDALLCELEDFDYLLGIHCNMPIDDVDPAWYINPQFIGR